MQVLISIKPQYVKQIVLGTKKFEYRSYPLTGITDLWVYTTLPVGTITHKIVVGKAQEHNDEYAIPIISVHELSQPISLVEMKQKGIHPPQKYSYIDEELLTFFEKRIA